MKQILLTLVAILLSVFIIFSIIIGTELAIVNYRMIQMQPAFLEQILNQPCIPQVEVKPIKKSKSYDKSKI